MKENSPAKRARRSVVAALAVALGGGFVANAWGQSFVDRLINVLRNRIPAVIGGFGAELPAAPEYVAVVLQQIVSRNSNETADASWMMTTDATRARIGTVTVVIAIASNGQLISASVASTTGQGRGYSGKAVDAVRRAAPFPRPIPLDRNVQSGAVRLDEVFLIQDSGRWNLESFVEASRARSEDRP